MVDSERHYYLGSSSILSKSTSHGDCIIVENRRRSAF